jgi:hypothetical protein
MKAERLVAARRKGLAALDDELFGDMVGVAGAFGEEVADARDAADFGGGVQGVEAVVVVGFQVGTCFEEKVDDL